MRHKNSQAIYAYWNALRRDRLAPLRLEIQPSHIADLLPDTYILEKLDPRSFQFRLAGTRICTRFGMELRGINFLDIWDEGDRDMLEHHFAAVTESGRVALLTIEAMLASKQPLAFEIAVLPLLHTGAAIDRLLCCMSAIDEGTLNFEERIASVRLMAVETVWPQGRPHQVSEAMARQSPLAPEVRNARIVRQDRRQFRVYDGGLGKEEPGKA